MPSRKTLRKGNMEPLAEEATAIEIWLDPFRRVFTRPTFLSACALAMGALLCLNRRTVSAALRAVDWCGMDFCRLHRVLSRSIWSPLAASRILLGLLVAVFVPEGTIIIAVDETVERRWGKKIADRGIYRDAVRSTAGFFVKCSGLRWMCFALVVDIEAFGGLRIALPFFTVLCPSERADAVAGRRHLPTAGQAGRALKLFARWLPGRRIALLGDGGFGCQTLFADARALSAKRTKDSAVFVVARLRLDARLFDPPVPGATDSRGRPRIVAGRQPTPQARLDDPASAWTPGMVDGHAVERLDGEARWASHGHALPIRWALVRRQDAGPRTEPWVLGCSDGSVGAGEMADLYARRWAIETTFEEARRHLGIETQRQWSRPAILRTTPALFALYSLVVLWAHGLTARGNAIRVLGGSWRSKAKPTFSDLLAAVRRELWRSEAVRPLLQVEAELRASRSEPRSRQVKPPLRPLAERFSDLICWAS